MTKTELTRIIADRSGIETAAVKLILDEFAEQVCDCLARGESYYHRGLGTFGVVKRAAKTGWIVAKRERIAIPPHYTPKWTPCPELKNRVKKEVKL